MLDSTTVSDSRALRLALALLAAALLAAAPAAARAGAPRVDRPLGVDTPGTFRQLVLDLPLTDARRAGPWLEARWTETNDWSLPTRLARAGRKVDVQLDEQADRLALLAHVPWAAAGVGGLRARISTTVEWRVIQHWGGFTDGGIEEWHRIGHFQAFGRPASPQDKISIRLAEPGGDRVVDLHHPRTAAGDLAVRTSLRIAEGERDAGPWAVALRLDLKAPLGRPADAGGSGSPDAALGLAASVPLLPWLTVHAQGFACRAGPLPGAVPLRLRPWQLGIEASVVAWRGDWALAFESRWLSPLFESGWTAVTPPSQGDAVTAVERSQNQLTGGVRWRSFTLWVSEDWTPGSRREVRWYWFYNSNAPDLAIGVSFVQPL